MILESKTEHLKLKIEIVPDAATKQIISKLRLEKRLEAIGIGIRSELVMFLLNLEKEIGEDMSFL